MDRATLQECIRRLDKWSAYGHNQVCEGVGIINRACTLARDEGKGYQAFRALQNDCRAVSNTLKSLIKLREEFDAIQGKGWEATQ